MGEARRKRVARKAAGLPPLPYTPNVPRLREFSIAIAMTVFEQMEIRRARLNVSRNAFVEMLLTAGIEVFDAAVTLPDVGLVKTVPTMPPGIAEAARRLQEIKRGAR